MTVRLGLGLTFQSIVDPKPFWRLIDFCEATGVHSVWQSDRLISRDPHLETLSTLAAIAGATRHLQLGMIAVVAGYRDPLVLAKQCATIDHLSEGRLIPVFGVGAPWNPEWEATGRGTRGRGIRADEVLEIVQRLWREDAVHFDGRFFRYANASISPKPFQPDMPMWISGSSEAAIGRAARLGTGWLGGLCTPELTRKSKELLSMKLKENNRSIAQERCGVLVPYRFGALDDAPVQKMITRITSVRAENFYPTRSIAVGGAREITKLLMEHVSAGASQFVMLPLADDETEVFDQTARLMNEVKPAVESGSGP